ncbi:MAG: 2-phosphosulfolactate phosphatase [Lentimicrobiaceae bacterium]|jgi:2-phosphosulfolactate phosphatase
MNSIEVCLSPALFQFKTTTENYIVVIVDVLRATTAFCAAFDSGVKTVIPVLGLEELIEYKNKGYLTAAERDGKKVDFADFGNSPTVFLQSSLSGKELAYSTTNGTKAVEMAKTSGNIVAASFVNLDAVSDWLISKQMNVVVLCSGWKNTFSLEDTLCAGALVESLVFSGKFAQICDASVTSLMLWRSSKNKLIHVVQKANHYQRLSRMGLLEDLQHCFRLNSSKVVPVWDENAFKDMSEK